MSSDMNGDESDRSDEDVLRNGEIGVENEIVEVTEEQTEEIEGEGTEDEENVDFCHEILLELVLAKKEVLVKYKVMKSILLEYIKDSMSLMLMGLKPHPNEPKEPKEPEETEETLFSLSSTETRNKIDKLRDSLMDSRVCQKAFEKLSPSYRVSIFTLRIEKVLRIMGRPTWCQTPEEIALRWDEKNKDYLKEVIDLINSNLKLISESNNIEWISMVEFCDAITSFLRLQRDNGFDEQEIQRKYIVLLEKSANAIKENVEFSEPTAHEFLSLLNNERSFEPIMNVIHTYLYSYLAPEVHTCSKTEESERRNTMNTIEDWSTDLMIYFRRLPSKVASNESYESWFRERNCYFAAKFFYRRTYYINNSRAHLGIDLYRKETQHVEDCRLFLRLWKENLPRRDLKMTLDFGKASRDNNYFERKLWIQECRIQNYYGKFDEDKDPPRYEFPKTDNPKRNAKLEFYQHEMIYEFYARKISFSLPRHHLYQPKNDPEVSKIEKKISHLLKNMTSYLEQSKRRNYRLLEFLRYYAVISIRWNDIEESERIINTIVRIRNEWNIEEKYIFFEGFEAILGQVILKKLQHIRKSHEKEPQSAFLSLQSLKKLINRLEEFIRKQYEKLVIPKLDVLFEDLSSITPRDRNNDKNMKIVLKSIPQAKGTNEILKSIEKLEKEYQNVVDEYEKCKKDCDSHRYKHVLKKYMGD